MSSGCSCSEDFTGNWWQFPPLRNALLAGLLAGAGFVLAQTGVIGAVGENLFYWLAIPLGGYLWAQEGLEELWREHEIGISFLMIAATFGSGMLGMWEEAAALVVLYGIAEGVEEFTFARTRTAIRALLDLTPKEARVLRDGREQMIPAEQLQAGDHFVVRPGEALVTDGVIIDGASSLDESAVTGESMPVDKSVGMKVFAASLNGQGALTIEATAKFSDNSLSRIIHLVEDAQEHKGRAQQWIERFGRRYSPMVLLSAIAILLFSWLLSADMLVWSERAVILLVAAAPCALVISLPIAMAAGISGAGRRGILIKGGAHLENLGRIRIIAFDKTGTLTYGRPAVTDIIALQRTEEELLARAAALEQFSQHPLARAIVTHSREKQIPEKSSTNFLSLMGEGVKAEIEGEEWYIGKPQIFYDMGVSLEASAEQFSALQAEGKTVVLLGNRKAIHGIIALQDSLRDGVKVVLESLDRAGLRTVMLSGDNRDTASQIAARLGINDVRAELKPEDKVRAILELEQQGPVLMIGDGVNDAPALAVATCGVAMGAAGSDAAIEAADIALMADDLGKLEEAMQLGKKARRVSYQNIVFAIIVLAVLIPAGVAGLISIAMVVLAHEASELLAIANGLRAGRQ